MNLTLDINVIVQGLLVVVLSGMGGVLWRMNEKLGRHDERLKAIERDVKEADEKASAALYQHPPGWRR